MASNVISSGLNLMNTAYNGAGGIVLSGDAVKGGYFAGYYNGKQNIVGRRLFVEV